MCAQAVLPADAPEAGGGSLDAILASPGLIPGSFTTTLAGTEGIQRGIASAAADDRSANHGRAR